MWGRLAPPRDQPAKPWKNFPASWSDARIPRIPGIGIGSSQTFPEPLQVIGDREMVDIFDALVAELPGHTQPQRPSERHRQFSAVHAVRHERLRMQSIRHVDALP